MRRLRVTSSRVNSRLLGRRVRAKISKLPTTPIPLPDLDLKDIEKKEGGMRFRDVIGDLSNTFYGHITSAVTSAPGRVGAALRGIVHLPLNVWDLITGKEQAPTEEAP